MKIVKILGGLGNQMFQYALACSLKAHQPKEEVKLDLHCFRGYHLHNGYELDKLFHPAFQAASLSEIIKVAYPYCSYNVWRVGSRILPRRKSMITENTKEAVNTSILSLKASAYYDGYWQSEEYFKDIRGDVLKAFTFPSFDEKNKAYAEVILNSNSLSIHVRRGDFINHPLYKDICTLQYYQNAIKRISALTKIDHVFIFSNDIQWCKDNMSAYLRGIITTYIDWNKGAQSYNDIHLMSLCKHNIIANSSFSWWGAWLNKNPNKVVISPQTWDNSEAASNPICKDWIRI
jgi:hypothetical protein